MGKPTIFQAEADQHPEREAGATGDPFAALETYRGLVAAMQAAGMDAESVLEDAVDLSNVLRAMSDLSRRNGEPETAESVSAQRSELWNGWARKVPGNAFVRGQLAEMRTKR